MVGRGLVQNTEKPTSCEKNHSSWCFVPLQQTEKWLWTVSGMGLEEGRAAAELHSPPPYTAPGLGWKLQ